MSEETADSTERKVGQGQRDARRLLSRYYLDEIDRINAAFIEHPDERPNSDPAATSLSTQDARGALSIYPQGC